MDRGDKWVDKTCPLSGKTQCLLRIDYCDAGPFRGALL